MSYLGKKCCFRLAYFERKHKFYSPTQLLSEVKAHYIGQFVKQLYVLVLGLDVLGNPFGLVTGFKQGVEDFFYEPFQVIIILYVPFFIESGSSCNFKSYP